MNIVLKIKHSCLAGVAKHTKKKENTLLHCDLEEMKSNCNLFFTFKTLMMDICNAFNNTDIKKLKR